MKTITKNIATAAALAAIFATHAHAQPTQSEALGYSFAMGVMVHARCPASVTSKIKDSETFRQAAQTASRIDEAGTARGLQAGMNAAAMQSDAMLCHESVRLLIKHGIVERR